MDPGKMHTYVWEIQQNQGPTDGDSPCLTHSYSSNIDSVKDTNSGLIGALLVCRPGKSNPGWGQVRCSHGLRGRGIKDTSQRLTTAVGSVSCGQQQHFWGLALSPKSSFPVWKANTPGFPCRRENLVNFCLCRISDDE